MPAGATTCVQAVWGRHASRQKRAVEDGPDLPRNSVRQAPEIQRRSVALLPDQLERELDLAGGSRAADLTEGPMRETRAEAGATGSRSATNRRLHQDGVQVSRA